jgi:hypothetical protein
MSNVALERLGPKATTEVSADASRHGGLEVNFKPARRRGSKLAITYSMCLEC